MMSKTRRELISFFIVSFLWMWLINFFRILEARDVLSLNPILSMIMGYIAVFGPGIAAFVLTFKSSGKKGTKILWKRGWRLNFKKIWLLPTIILIPITAVLTLIILNILDVSIAWEAALPPSMVVPIGLLIWLLGAYPEEYGWRGYALPRLLEKNNPLTASLILGAVWGIWHLPLHLIPTTTQYVIPIWQYLLLTLVLSVLYTWLYLGTEGNLFIASLFHASGNIAGAVIPYWTSNFGRWVSFLVLMIPASIVAFHWLKAKNR